MSDIENKIVELVFKKLRTKAKARGASLRSEARGYWHTDRQKFHELKARGLEFDRFSSMIQEMWDDLPAYPAKEESNEAQK